MPNLYEVPHGYETRMKMVKAICQLSKTNDFESIKVTEICDQARVSRQTFYRYFIDKFDAVNWYHQYYAEKSLLKVGRTLTWYESVLKILEFVHDERDFYENILPANKDYNSLVNFSRRLNQTTMKRTIIEYNRLDLTRELEFALELWTRTGAEIVAEWVIKDFSYTPSEFASVLDECRPKRLQDAMDKPVLSRRKITPSHVSQRLLPMSGHYGHKTFE